MALQTQESILALLDARITEATERRDRAFLRLGDEAVIAANTLNRLAQDIASATISPGTAIDRARAAFADPTVDKGAKSCLMACQKLNDLVELRAAIASGSDR